MPCSARFSELAWSQYQMTSKTVDKLSSYLRVCHIWPEHNYSYRKRSNVSTCVWKQITATI